MVEMFHGRMAADESSPVENQDIERPEGARPVTHRDAILAVTKQFTQARLATPALDARLLVGFAAELPPEALISQSMEKMSDAALARLRGYVLRRLDGEPVSRIIGHREFWGLDFELSAETLDPRPETELIVDLVLRHVKLEGRSRDRLRILDLGTGSGCILAALLHELPNAYGVGIDRNFNAALTAQQNLDAMGLRSRGRAINANWCDAIALGKFDIVVSNPPYIKTHAIHDLSAEVARFDPILALDGGADGFAAFHKIIPGVQRVLRDGGFLVLETGNQQAETVRHLVQREGSFGSVDSIQIVKDFAGHQRAVAARRHL